jgi:uncharacterized damage-inducible protein DinB
VSRLIYVGQGLGYSPVILKRMVGQVDKSRYDEKLSPERFTLREMVAHMADMEPVMLYRMKLAQSTPGADIPNWDQDKEAIEKKYETWNVAESLEKFAEERAKTVSYYESLTEEQSILTLRHPILGVISVFDLAAFLLGHDAYHFEQVSSYLE